MTYTPEDFGPFTLSASSHDDPSLGMCVMEMVSFLAGEKWSDMPNCSSPVVARFCQVINDNSAQETRDRLQMYVPRLIGTASPEHDAERAEYLAWSAIRIFAPMALDACGISDHAQSLREFKGDLTAAARAATDAADAAADAACAAADAANAAPYAVPYTVRATRAAYAAIRAADAADATAVLFDVLDGLLKIGPSGTAYTQEHFDRVGTLRSAVRQEVA